MKNVLEKNSPPALVGIHVGVDGTEFFLQQLQVRVDEAQLECYGLTDFRVGGGAV